MQIYIYIYNVYVYANGRALYKLIGLPYSLVLMNKFEFVPLWWLENRGQPLWGDDALQGAGGSKPGALTIGRVFPSRGVSWGFQGPCSPSHKIGTTYHAFL